MGTGANSYSMIFSLLLIFAAMYFFLIRPQKKKEKTDQMMRSSIEVGDQVVTIGGVAGKVVSVKDDDTFVIETGADKTKIKFYKWAIRSKIESADEE